MKDRYRKQVALLIRIMPSVYRIQEFAVHGGTAINLFHKNMPRYSIDIDLTYIPIKDRAISLAEINQKLLDVKKSVEKTIPGITVRHKPEVWKLMCTLGEATVKIEVNGTKRGIIGRTEDMPLCEAAQKEFSMGCKARTVSFSQLYGGKIAALFMQGFCRPLRKPLHRCDGRILFEHELVTVGEQLQRVPLADAQRPADLLRNDHTPEFVDPSHDPRCLHVLPPYTQGFPSRILSFCPARRVLCMFFALFHDFSAG